MTVFWQVVPFYIWHTNEFCLHFSSLLNLTSPRLTFWSPYKLPHHLQHFQFFPDDSFLLGTRGEMHKTIFPCLLCGSALLFLELVFTIKEARTRATVILRQISIRACNLWVWFCGRVQVGFGFTVTQKETACIYSNGLSGDAVATLERKLRTWAIKPLTGSTFERLRIFI